MKTRTLFLTLFTSISVLLIAQGFAFAATITGCLVQKSGKLYNVVEGTAPLEPCNVRDAELTWNQGGAPQFILKDSASPPKQVGDVITVNDDSASFVDMGLQVTNRSVLTALDIQKADATTATVGISVDRFNIRFQHRLFFENFDCLGTPRTRDIIVDSDFPPAFTTSAIVVGVPGQPDARKLYVQTDEAEIPQTLEHFSILIESDCLNRPIDNPLIFPTVSMELVDGLLDQTFPGPYTLEGPAGAGGGGAITAAGVIGSDGSILFTVNENFFSTRTAVGFYLIEVDERLECRFRADGQQAALGPRLATPINGSVVQSFLFFVASDIAGVCNDSAVYEFRIRQINAPADGTFSFQITGRKDL